MNEMIDVRVAVAAPKEAAWAVLADYGNVHAYVRGSLDAYLTTEQASGVGMTPLPSISTYSRSCSVEMIEA